MGLRVSAYTHLFNPGTTCIGGDMRICKIVGCNKKHDSHGYCGKHNMQIKRYGIILKRTIRDRNEIKIKNNIAEIILYNRKNKEVARAIIDVEDVERVKNYKWSLTPQGYVRTVLNGKDIKIQHILMGKGLIDHKDRNRLNNRKSNFRQCTTTENLRNRRKPKNNTSGYKGVWWNGVKWVSEIRINRKKLYLGAFKEKLDASMAYNRAAKKYFGEFACLNNL